jgi:hypothetical protein
MEAGVALLLGLAFRHPFSEPNAEAGFARVRGLTGAALDDAAIAAAVSACVADGLIRDPVQLPPGALQCHWRLSLTPKGAAAVRALPSTAGAD